MACWYVRCFLPMVHNGWSGNYLGLEQTLKPVEVVAEEMRNSEVIVFHRANTNWHHRVGMIARQMGKYIVFDNDDTFKMENTHPFFGLDEDGFAENREQVNNVINNFVLNADMVTCSTESLRQEYSEINKNTIVLPNYIDPDDWDEPLENDTGKVRIGFVGSVGYAHDYEHVKNVIRELGKDKRVQLVLFGLWSGTKRATNPKVEQVFKNEYAFWDTIEKEHAPWVPIAEYQETLNDLKLDMMLIPRRENDFNRAKSNIKFLEASMLKIPVIAQSFSDGTSPYDYDINGDNGVLVKDNWLEAVYDLIDNPDKRKKLGENAYNYTIKNYNIADHAHKWDEAYTKLCEKSK